MYCIAPHKVLATNTHENEFPQTLALRLRDAFYQLPGPDRESDKTRTLLKELIMTHLPCVWTLAYPHAISSDNYELTEMIVQISAQVTKQPNETGISENQILRPIMYIYLP